MKAHQRTIVLVGVMALVLLVLFPPWEVFTSGFAEPDVAPMTFKAGHHFILSPPVPAAPAWNRRVDLKRLVALGAAVIGLTGAGVLVAKRGQARRPRAGVT
jgi:hypothetical protein